MTPQNDLQKRVLCRFTIFKLFFSNFIEFPKQIFKCKYLSDRNSFLIKMKTLRVWSRKQSLSGTCKNDIQHYFWPGEHKILPPGKCANCGTGISAELVLVLQ